MGDIDIMAKTIYAEARGESIEGQEWVGHVILNRSKKRKLTITQVCQQPFQFECWNGKTDINILEPKAFETAKEVAKRVLERDHDPTGGCDHYLNPAKLPKLPSWADKLELVKVIGNHTFYR